MTGWLGSRYLPEKRRAVAPLERIDEEGPAHNQFVAAIESFPDEQDDYDEDDSKDNHENHDDEEEL